MPLLPDDLRPIPTRPYAVRPDDEPLDREEVRTALWRSDGNISKAAALIKVSSRRLRTFINNSEYLRNEMQEAHDRLVDTAEDVISAALQDPERRDAASRFVLDRLGRDRGWGNGANKVDVDARGGTIQMSWADGTTLTVTPNEEKREEKVIEHVVD